MRNLSEGEAAALTWIALIAGVTIIATAFAFRPASCVDDKAKNLHLLGQLADLKTQRAVIEPGVCVDYESSRQRICRRTMINGGTLYLLELPVDGKKEQVDE